MKTPDILLIGAGSVGLPLAYNLADKGVRVLVIEKEVSPGRGQNRAAIGGIRATHSVPGKIVIGKRSIEIVKRMEEIFGSDVDWFRGGYLFPVYEKGTEEKLKDLLVKQQSYGLDINWIGPEDIAELVPGINSRELLGGTWSPGDGSANPLKVLGQYYKAAREKGVVFSFGETVTAVKKKGNRVVTVEGSRDTYTPGFVVNAAGAHASGIGKLIGETVPVYPAPHEAGVTEPVKRFFNPMIVDTRSIEGSDNCYFYQNKEGPVIFCVTPNPEITGNNNENRSNFLPGVIRRMLYVYPRLRNLRVRRTWRGLYPMTPDGLPIVGFSQKIENLFHLGGMCGQGFMLGPGLGEILAEVLVEKTQEYNSILEELSPHRDFSGEELLK
ncbi:MAG: FAD-binding oxidoreductase [bacterium]|nr:FAD-binding oxidoreductase [bacterium]